MSFHTKINVPLKDKALKGGLNRMRKIGKQAKSGVMVWGAIIAIVLVALLAMLVYQVGFKQQAFGTQTSAEGGYISTGATTVTVSGSDALNPGTAVTGTTSVSINGNPFITDDFSLSVSPKQKLDILVINNTGYHNVYVTGYEVPSSPTDAKGVQLKGNATVTIVMFNTDNSKMDASGAAVNQTVATGGAYNMKIRIDGQDKKSTNDMVCILESSDGTKTDKMTLNGFGATYKGMSKPSSYTLLGSSSAIWVYDVPAIEGAVSPEGVISVTSKTGQTMAGVQFKITCRTKESFLDSQTGKVLFDIEDSSGTAKSMATYSFTDYFT